MKLYCPNCLHTFSEQEVNATQNVVNCHSCKTQDSFARAKEISTQIADIEDNHYKENNGSDAFANYPTILPSFQIKSLETLESGEETLYLSFKQSKFSVIFALLYIIALLAIYYVLDPINMIRALQENSSGNAFMDFALPILVSIGFAFLLYQCVLYFLRAFVPESVKVVRGKVIYTSIWGRETTYFEQEIANILPSIKIVRTKNGEQRIPVLTFFLENKKKRDIFENIEENEARWAGGMIKRYLHKTGFGN